MDTQIAAPDEGYKISPEALEIAKTYLACHDTKETALALGIPPEKVSYYLRKPDVKRFVDAIFLEQGYMNRGKLQDVMDDLFEKKLEEMEDSEMGTSKDIVDLITLQHKMRMEEIKALKDAGLAPNSGTTVRQQINVGGPAFGGDNYNNLLGELIKAGKE
jgi:hypothetical protein